MWSAQRRLLRCIVSRPERALADRRDERPLVEERNCLARPVRSVTPASDQQEARDAVLDRGCSRSKRNPGGPDSGASHARVRTNSRAATTVALSTAIPRMQVSRACFAGPSYSPIAGPTIRSEKERGRQALDLSRPLREREEHRRDRPYEEHRRHRRRSDRRLAPRRNRQRSRSVRSRPRPAGQDPGCLQRLDALRRAGGAIRTLTPLYMSGGQICTRFVRVRRGGGARGVRIWL